MATSNNSGALNIQVPIKSQVTHVCLSYVQYLGLQGLSVFLFPIIFDWKLHAL